jgi:hypothetical protein
VIGELLREGGGAAAEVISLDDDPELRTVGVRVPAIVIGPRVRNHVCHIRFDHTTLIKTILTRFVPEEEGRRERAIVAMPPRVRKADTLGLVLGDRPRGNLPDPERLRPKVDEVIGLMRDARRPPAKRPLRHQTVLASCRSSMSFRRSFCTSPTGCGRRVFRPDSPDGSRSEHLTWVWKLVDSDTRPTECDLGGTLGPLLSLRTSSGRH